MPQGFATVWWGFCAGIGAGLAFALVNGLIGLLASGRKAP